MILNYNFKSGQYNNITNSGDNSIEKGDFIITLNRDTDKTVIPIYKYMQSQIKDASYI